jgi:tetratricopeptide (TPR) repeat protein
MNRIRFVALLVALLGTLLFLNNQFNQPETWESINGKGLSAFHESNYAEAEQHFIKAVKLGKTFSSDDHRLNFSLNQLAEIYRIQSKFAEAEQVLKQLLESYKIKFGPSHINVALTLNNLAANSRTQGKFEDAEILLKQALKIIENSLGAEHPIVGNLLEHYAHLLRQANRTTEAEEIEKRYHEIYSRLGTDN